MNAEQYEGLMTKLGQILDRMPGGDIPAEPEPVAPVPDRGVTTPNDMRKVAQRQALRAVLSALNGWIDGVHENHQALGHRHENRGEECWRTFTPSDIRRMINDATRELGFAPFPMPTSPREDELTH